MSFSKKMLRIVYMDCNIIAPTNITNLFGNCLAEAAKQDKVQIRVGVCALLCDIRNTRNDNIYNNANSKIYAGNSVD
jgi:hypothetical protein